MSKLGYGGGMKYRTISPETKMAAVLEGLRGESTVADICRKYQIRENLYYLWRDAFLEGGRSALTDNLLTSSACNASALRGASKQCRSSFLVVGSSQALEMSAS